MAPRRGGRLSGGGDASNGGRNGDGGSGGDSIEELESAQQQLEKLRKQHRMRERNRKQYKEEATVLLNRQRTILAALEKEKKELLEELRSCQHHQNERREREAALALTSTIQRHQDYERDIASVNDEISGLQDQIREAERRLRQQAHRRPALRLLEEARLQQEDQNKTLSNRIQQTTVRLNAVLADNARLRTDIESQLKERDKFLLQADRLEKQIAVTAKRKSDVMEVVTKAYSEREEAGTKIRAVRERVMRDTRSHNMELKKLQRILDHQTHLKSFVTTIAAGEETTKDDTQEAEDHGGPMETLQYYRDSLATLVASSASLTDASTLIEEANKEKSNGLLMENGQPSKANGQKDSSGRRSKVPGSQAPTDADALEKSDLADTIINNFLQSENDNYTIFSFVSGVNNEASGVVAEIARLQEELQEMQQKQTVEQQRALQATTMLQERCDSAERATEEMTAEALRAEEALTNIKCTVSELLTVLRCDTQPLRAVTGGDQVTTSNQSVFLTLVEQRVADLMSKLPLQDTESPVADDITERPSTGVSPAEGKPLQLLQRPTPPSGGGAEDDSGSPLGHSALMESLYRNIAPHAT